MTDTDKEETTWVVDMQSDVEWSEDDIQRFIDEFETCGLDIEQK